MAAWALAGGFFGYALNSNSSSSSEREPTTADTVTAFDSAGPMEDAVTACGESPHLQVLDDGASLSLSGEGSESPGADALDVYCVLTELEAPESVISRMDRTRALDGTQDATWGDYTASWTYHPDSGVNVIVEQR